MAPDKQEQRQCDYYGSGSQTAKFQDKCHRETEEERNTRGNEPSANYGYDACNTEHRTFPAPRAVGKRRSHSHHKCHISGRKRQGQ